MIPTEKISYDIILTMEQDTIMSTPTKEVGVDRKALMERNRNNKGMPEIAQHRARLGKEFMARMRADFQKHGIATIERVRKEKPAAYLELVARMIPMQMEVNVNHTFMDLLQEAQKRYQEQAYPRGNVFDAEVVVEE